MDASDIGEAAGELGANADGASAMLAGLKSAAEPILAMAPEILAVLVALKVAELAVKAAMWALTPAIDGAKEAFKEFARAARRESESRKKAIEEGCEVTTLPGPTASLTALVTSGIPCDKFLFYGFLNSKKSIAKQELINIKEEEYTLIFYEAPHRIMETLLLMKDVLGDRKIAIVREISKVYEEIIRDNISNIIKNCDKIKGEIVIVVEGYKKTNKTIDYSKEIEKLIANGYSKKDAIKEVADKYSISKNKLYNEYIKEN